jgi:hypothetical protein
MKKFANKMNFITVIFVLNIILPQCASKNYEQLKLNVDRSNKNLGETELQESDKEETVGESDKEETVGESDKETVGEINQDTIGEQDLSKVINTLNLDPNTSKQAIEALNNLRIGQNLTENQKKLAENVTEHLATLETAKNITEELETAKNQELTPTSEDNNKATELRKILEDINGLINKGKLTNEDEEKFNLLITTLSKDIAGVDLGDSKISPVLEAIKSKYDLKFKAKVLEKTKEIKTRTKHGNEERALDKYNRSAKNKIEFLDQTAEAIQNAHKNLIDLINLDKTSKYHKRRFFKLFASQAESLINKINEVNKKQIANIKEAKKEIDKAADTLNILNEEEAEITQAIINCEDQLAKNKGNKKQLETQIKENKDKIKQLIYAKTEAGIILNKNINAYKSAIEEAICESRKLYNESVDFYEINKDKTKENIKELIESLQTKNS